MSSTGRNRGNAVAIALAALAVVIAGAGTAVAVTATVVKIADPVTPSHVARVDDHGRLSAGGARSGINVAEYAFAGSNALLTSPTTATLVVSRFAGFNTAVNSGFPHTNFRVGLEKVTADSAGSCSGTGSSTSAFLSEDRLPWGSTFQDTYPAPLVFKPTGTRKYCIAAFVDSEDGTAPGTYYLPFVQLTAYSINGPYSGAGTSPIATAQPGKAPFVTPRTGHRR